MKAEIILKYEEKERFTCQGFPQITGALSS